MTADLIFLDFAKAFDSVPYSSSLIKELSSYGITGNVLQRIEVWLMCRSQQVVLDVVSSTPVLVKSAVPQGIVLGPILFLVYINNIVNNITLSLLLCLFADDCLLYRIIQSERDVAIYSATRSYLLIIV